LSESFFFFTSPCCCCCCCFPFLSRSRTLNYYQLENKKQLNESLLMLQVKQALMLHHAVDYIKNIKNHRC
jgi:hypothetical protein